MGLKVLDDNGQGESSVIKGVEVVTDHVTEIDASKHEFWLHLSVGRLAAAIHNSVLAGVTYAVAAGNDGKDAAGTSPANYPDVMTFLLSRTLMENVEGLELLVLLVKMIILRPSVITDLKLI